MRTAIDTNVISALWSQEAMAAQAVASLGNALAEGGLTISGPVYAELLAYPRASLELLNQFLSKTNISVDFVIGEEVWVLAAKAFAEYAIRRRRSDKNNPKRLLTDFIIGAHATLHADRFLTFDRERYQRSFPKLKMLP